MPMNFTNRICQVLHEEHAATIALLQRLEQLTARHRRDDPPNVKDGFVAKLLSDLATSLTIELERHFAVEEEHLFAYLDAAGDQGIGAHLLDEHKVIRPLVARVTALARRAAAGGFDAESWKEFHRTGRELCERLQAHAEKEEMALLPAIEDGMDAETETRLLAEYVETA
jgi:hemerythrin-like domain-containing protein